MEHARVTFYRQRSVVRRGWRWRHQAAGNAAVLADSGQAYTEFWDCLDGWAKLAGVRPEALRYTLGEPEDRHVVRSILGGGRERIDVVVRDR